MGPHPSNTKAHEACYAAPNVACNSSKQFAAVSLICASHNQKHVCHLLACGQASISSPIRQRIRRDRVGNAQCGTVMERMRLFLHVEWWPCCRIGVENLHPDMYADVLPDSDGGLWPNCRSRGESENWAALSNTMWFSLHEMLSCRPPWCAEGGL